jgi:hypothetical protein
VESARELYERDATFRAGIAAWVADQRCDVKLVDLLLEHGLTGQADCARWAATEPDRTFALDRDRGIKCGPFPAQHAGHFYWHDCNGGSRKVDSHDVPRAHFGRIVNYKRDKFSSATDAILFLLDNWKPEPNLPDPTRKSRPTPAPKTPEKPARKPKGKK